MSCLVLLVFVVPLDVQAACSHALIVVKVGKVPIGNVLVVEMVPVLKVPVVGKVLVVGKVPVVGEVPVVNVPISTLARISQVVVMSSY